MSTDLEPLHSLPAEIEQVTRIVLDTVSSPATKRDYARELAAFYSFYKASEQQGLNRRTVIGYRASMEEQGRGPVSVNKALSAIRKLAKEAAEYGLIDRGTAASIDDIKGVQRRGRRLGNWLSLEELRTLLSAVPPTTPNRGARDRAALWILGTTGLRREEAAALRFGQMQHRNGKPVFVDVLGKGNKLRTVPMHPLCEAAVRSWCMMAGITSAEAYLLPTIHNPDRISTQPCSGARLYDACVRYCRAFQLHFRPHDLRRTFAVLARKGGAELEAIRDALGHSSVTTTEIYLAGASSLENPAAEKILL
jgi:site-specific recombinase XerD